MHTPKIGGVSSLFDQGCSTVSHTCREWRAVNYNFQISKENLSSTAKNTGNPGLLFVSRTGFIQHE